MSLWQFQKNVKRKCWLLCRLDEAQSGSDPRGIYRREDESLDNIRAKIRESGGEFHVVKNTLARRAFADSGMESSPGLSGEEHSRFVRIYGSRFDRKGLERCHERQ
jgi:hypothetical protein